MDAADIWLPFRGDNAAEIEAYHRPPGPARIQRHLGKPLSGELWDDILRLRVRSLRVCTPADLDDDGLLKGHIWHQLVLFLDHADNLCDLWLHGRCPPRKAGVTFEDS